MGKIIFDPTKSDLYDLARLIVIERLQEDKSWEQFDSTGLGFDKYVDYIGHPRSGREKLKLIAIDILWNFMVQGILAPGKEGQNIQLPVFHSTEYGKKVLEKGKFLPHDPSGYIGRVQQIIVNPHNKQTKLTH